MLIAFRTRTAEHDDEEGFTLIELMVVVLIIGILLAIAVPTFLGARDRTNNRSAQSNLRNALTSEKTLFADPQSYTASPATVLSTIEPSLNWVATVAGGRDVSAVVLQGNSGVAANPSEIILSAKSATGICYYIGDEALSSGAVASPGTYYAASQTCTNPTALWGTTPPPPGTHVDPTNTTTTWAASF